MYKGGKFLKDNGKWKEDPPDGEDLFGLEKEDLIRILGDTRGPSLYSLLRTSGMSYLCPLQIMIVNTTATTHIKPNN
ncbi:MAG: hypothetical protein ACXV2C_00650 [Candidatus Bathyarchaeia archaeon]